MTRLELLNPVKLNLVFYIRCLEKVRRSESVEDEINHELKDQNSHIKKFSAYSIGRSPLRPQLLALKTVGTSLDIGKFAKICVQQSKEEQFAKTPHLIFKT